MRKIAFTLFGFVCLCVLNTHAQNLVSLSSGDDVEAVRTAIKNGADVNQVDANGTSPLMTACRWGKADIVKLLLQNGAKVDEPKSPKGRTPLMVACAYYSGLNIVTLLVEKGANVNAVDDNGVTALMLAAGNAKLNTVKYLLAHEANNKLKDNNGLSAKGHAQSLEQSTIDYVKSSIKDDVLDKAAVIDILNRLE